MIILQIIGGIVVFLIFVAVCIYYFFKFKFGKLLDIDSSVNHSPLSIHINEELFPQWLEDKKTIDMISKIESHGFHKSKSYGIPEMEDVQLLSFFKESYTAVLYKHDAVGLWIDLFAISDDGSEITVTDMPMGSGIDNRPEMKKYVMQGSSVDEMMKQFDDYIKNIKLKKIDDDNFRTLFEEAYEKDIQWRNRNGGISFEEFLSVEKETNVSFKEKHVKEAFIETKLQELRQWHSNIIEQYIESNNVSEEDGYDLEYQSIIVPEKTDPVSFAHYLKEKDFISENVNLEKLTEHFKDEVNIKTIFDSLNSRLSPDLRASIGGSFNHPLNADLYLIPERKYD